MKGRFFMSAEILEKYTYTWPPFEPKENLHWEKSRPDSYVRNLRESPEDLQLDSRWPAFFPCSISFATTGDGSETAVEKVVGASIVNRFPYVIALSFCVSELSKRHYARNRFIEILERNGTAAIQFFELGQNVDTILKAIQDIPDGRIDERVGATGLPTRRAKTSEAPIFNDAYMVYEARLVSASKDFSGAPIYEETYTEFGSHRIYFLEIQAIQLREDIARGASSIHWRALPHWQPRKPDHVLRSVNWCANKDGYRKGYTPNYVFPSPNTVAFEHDYVENGMAVVRLPTTAEGQVEFDNDRARWPCFFPSSAGLITSWGKDNVPNLMPCGSTTVLVRSPLCIGIFVSYADVNERYSRRATLRALDDTGRFACGVPFDNDKIVEAIKYAGNISIDKDIDKIHNSGLEYEEDEWAPILTDVPVTFMCKVVQTLRLGTHIMYLGEVVSIRIRDDVTKENPLSWWPFPDVRKARDHVLD
ncbi:flavin reductase family protein [Rhizobium binxianense]|uniref:flavin reductase family protein n=1 Tax=Rhizobium binxianense TaxID=3024242 RepID=UPI0023603260|nr:flavin reductase [Rhizobium sp. MC62]MDC9814093.1 flavin reductase [Rhizobium sp. MC62]